MREYLHKRDTDYVRDNLIFNYCLGNEQELLIESFLHNNQIELDFNPQCFYFFMTGTHNKFVRPYTPDTFYSGISNYFEKDEAARRILRENGYTGKPFLTKQDNSKQFGVFFSPQGETKITPLEMAHRLYETYTTLEQDLDGHYLDRISTSFVGPYSGYEPMHRAFMDARALNDLYFFGVRDTVITRQFREQTARPCDITAILANIRRLTSTLCTGTKKEALRQIDYLIDEMVAPSYLQLNFAALWAAFEDVLSMFETVYPERVTVEHGKLESFFTLEQYKQWAHRVVEALYAQLEGLRRYSPTLLMVLSFINRNYTTDLSLSQLAEYAYTNASTLSSEFNNEMGMSLSEYITGLRIQKAQELLRKTDMTVSEIAEASGFSGAKYFREIFKKQAGMSPQQYRDNP